MQFAVAWLSGVLRGDFPAEWVFHHEKWKAMSGAKKHEAIWNLKPTTASTTHNLPPWVSGSAEVAPSSSWLSNRQLMEMFYFQCVRRDLIGLLQSSGGVRGWDLTLDPLSRGTPPLMIMPAGSSGPGRELSDSTKGEWRNKWAVALNWDVSGRCCAKKSGKRTFVS